MPLASINLGFIENFRAFLDNFKFYEDKIMPQLSQENQNTFN
jgi:hypothetical protein